MILRGLCSQMVQHKTPFHSIFCSKLGLHTLSKMMRPNANKMHSLHQPRRFKRVLDFNLKNYFISERTIHISKCNQALPPIIWVLLRQVLKFTAVITGRGLKKWWARLPKSKRTYFLNEIKKNRPKIIKGVALSSVIAYIYYITHLVEDPITKRKKFLMFSEKQVYRISMIETESILENYKDQIVKSGHQYNYVLQITQRIIQANKNLPGIKKKWNVLLIDDKSIMNAFVLPSGYIFIFTGMLKSVTNEDQLAAVLAHEIAHALLNHSAEMLSKFHLIEMFMLLPIIAFWTIFPDSVAFFSHYFMEHFTSILLKLPFNRSLEAEADAVGLEMVARACFDPRQASVFWRKMEKLNQEEEIEWLSTHPSHKTRYETLDEQMSEALRILSIHCNKSDLDPHFSRLSIRG